MSVLLGLDGIASEQVDRILTQFIAENSDARQFSDLKDAERNKVWKLLFSWLEEDIIDDVKEKCLTSCRLLSRDRHGLNEAIKNSYVDQLVVLSGLTTSKHGQTLPADKVRFEAKQVLSNLIQQSSTVQAYCTKNGFLANVFGSIENHQVFGELEKLDLKLLFLMTALCPELRTEANLNLRGQSILNKALQSSVGDLCDMNQATYEKHVLQVLFNLTLHSEDESPDLINIAKTLKNVLGQKFEREEVKHIVIGNVINYLTNMDGCMESIKVIFLEEDMKNVQMILDYLLDRLERLSEVEKIRLKEEIAPSLSVLWIMSKMVPDIRRYLKRKVLPPLTKEDIQHKPEEGTSARSRLVALLTNPDNEISSMAAEFLFILCKQKVDKLVKHSGYGNAAGLLARKGLLAGGRSNGDFSSDEDSDTDEYKQQSQKINPITGRIEEERKNPMEGMTDEQKEYEAMKMVNVIDQLMKSGIIKPATIGEDGKPQAVEHVLQLQEGINFNTSSKDQDDD